MRFELLVAARYLKSNRKQAVISLITVISVIGVAAGVAALVIALAMNAGFREDLQDKLLGAQAHVSVLSTNRTPIANYRDVTERILALDGVVGAAPAIHQTVLISSGVQNKGVVLKGILPEYERRMSNLFDSLKEGTFADFREDSIIIGNELATSIGSFREDRVQILTAESRLTPLGAIPRFRPFRVAAIFSSGLYDYDSSWVYVPLEAAQRMLSLGDGVSTIEVRIRDIYQAPEVGRRIVQALGPEFDFTDWIQMNRSIFQALRMERLVMFIAIGLIVVVASLNIVVTLIMMVLEKTRDIAILMSMGATQDNIRRVFMCQGVIIGVVGTVAGLVLGHVLSFVADRYHLVSLAPDIYTLAYVPFRAQWMDSIFIAAAAIFVSFVATLYPSRAASRLEPVEALRYE